MINKVTLKGRYTVTALLEGMNKHPNQVYYVNKAFSCIDNNDSNCVGAFSLKSKDDGRVVQVFINYNEKDNITTLRNVFGKPLKGLVELLNLQGKEA